MTTRVQFVAEALTWQGTPFHHQAALRGVGADCIGLIRGTLAAFGIEARGIPHNYSRGPDATALLAAVEASDQLEEIDPGCACAGDLLLFRIGRDPRHFGLLIDAETFLHADNGFGVVRVPFSDGWRARLLRAWRLLDLEAA